MVGWVGYPPACVCEGDAEGFDYCVEVFGGVVLVLCEFWDLTAFFEGFEDSESHECYDSLAIWRMFPDFYSVIVFIASLT